jgi:uncharacterized protein (DUF1810 family)
LRPASRSSRRLNPIEAHLGQIECAIAQRFAIASRAEAVAYLGHDVLGMRLIQCTGLVTAASDKAITEILCSPDDINFRSCMTLFDAVSQQEISAEALGAFYPDGRDRKTLSLLDAYPRRC